MFDFYFDFNVWAIIKSFAILTIGWIIGYGWASDKEWKKGYKKGWSKGFDDGAIQAYEAIEKIDEEIKERLEKKAGWKQL